MLRHIKKKRTSTSTKERNTQGHAGRRDTRDRDRDRDSERDRERERGMKKTHKETHKETGKETIHQSGGDVR